MLNPWRLAMAVVVYPALITPAEAGGHQARFVDFAGSGVEAASAADLIRLAREWLHGELLRLEQAGETWPEPTAIHQLTPPAGGAVVLVDVSVDDTPVRLTISIGERLLKRIDDDAAARSMTRSGYLALGARRLLGDAAEPANGLGGETGRRIQSEIDAVGRRLNEALGPNSTVGRTLAELDALAVDGFRRLSDEVRSAIKPRRETPPPTGAPADRAPANGEPTHADG
jgi:hypothetical protein